MKKRSLEERLEMIGNMVCIVVSVMVIVLVLYNAKRRDENLAERNYVPVSEFDAMVHDFEMQHPDASFVEELNYIKFHYHPTSTTTVELHLEPEITETTEIIVEPVATQEELQTEIVVEPQDEGWSEDIRLLGDLMYAEEMQYTDDADGELVLKVCGSVVLHRMQENQGFFPNTIYDVIHDGEGTSHQQYATATLNKLGNIDTPEKVYQWAEELLRDGPIGPANLVFQDSQKHGEVWFQYGNQYFCTSEKISAEAADLTANVN